MRDSIPFLWSDAYTRKLRRATTLLPTHDLPRLRALFERALANAPAPVSNARQSLGRRLPSAFTHEQDESIVICTGVHEMHGSSSESASNTAQIPPDCGHCPLEAMLPDSTHVGRRRVNPPVLRDYNCVSGRPFHGGACLAMAQTNQNPGGGISRKKLIIILAVPSLLLFAVLFSLSSSDLRFIQPKNPAEKL